MVTLVRSENLGRALTETKLMVSPAFRECRERVVTPRGTSHIATAAATSFGNVACRLFRPVSDGRTPHTVASYPRRRCAQSAFGTVSCRQCRWSRSRKNSEIAGNRS